MPSAEWGESPYAVVVLLPGPHRLQQAPEAGHPRQPHHPGRPLTEYLVPITDVPDLGACLRVKPAKNNQAKGVRWAKDYVLGDKVKVADAAG